MESGGNKYEYIGENFPFYSWWSTNTVLSYKCSITTRIINAISPDSVVFNNACKVKELHCIQDRYTIVWRQDTIYICPFEPVSLGVNFTLDNGVFINEEKRIAFGFMSLEKYCGQTLIRTTEGLFLTKDHGFVETQLNLKRENTVDSNLISDLMLTENDFNNIENYYNTVILKFYIFLIIMK